MAERRARPGRTLPFVVGLCVLGAFLVGLVGVFLEEDETRRAETGGQRSALEAYASATLRRALEDEWRVGVALMEPAVSDPLLDDGALLLVSDGEEVLPRRARGQERGIVEAMEAALAGVELDTDDDTPAAERRRFVLALRRALEKNDRPAIEGAVRGLLAHRRQYRLAPRDDVSTVLAMVELLQREARPARQLLLGVLRDGFGPGEPGVQRDVLQSSARLSPGELSSVCGVVERQSRRAQVPVDDFARRCASIAGRQPPVVTEAPEGFTLARGWVLRGGREVRGVEVSVASLLEAQQQAMRERGLLGPDDSLTPTASAGPVEGLTVQVASRRWARAEESRRAALTLKLGLLALAFVLGVGMVALAFAVQRREQRLVEARSELVATVSHELRTPLASLRVMAETLERKVEGVPQAKDWPQRIVAEVDGLSALVENILSFNRLERGRDVFHRHPWALEEVRGWLEADAPPDVQVKVTGAERLVVDADPTWMRVAFLNLLRNARKYNERTPVTFEVSVSAHQGRAVIEVRDNGIGIPEAQWESVFEAFHRLRDARGRGGGGSGLGLAVVRRVVEGHGGSVRVAASSPAGTVFRISLPGGRFS
ncbi:MAG: HAMP domain-containing histidine kinase [Myxococcaceae bacterium]|nr:HAMP domain-containing histidine kinase [Myxococcaceae bacterium]